MNQSESARTQCLRRLSQMILIIGAAATVLFLLCHDSPLAIPEGAPPPTPKQIDEHRERLTSQGSAMFDALQGKVDLLITICFGLGALVGYTMKDGFSKNPWVMLTSSLLLGVFVFFLTRSMTYAFDVYSVIYVQVEQTQFFPAHLDKVATSSAESVVVAAIISIVLFLLRIFDESR